MKLELMTSKKLLENILETLKGFSDEYETKLSFSTLNEDEEENKEENIIKEGILNHNFNGIKLKKDSIEIDSIEIDFEDSIIHYNIKWIEAYNILDEDDIYIKINHFYTEIRLFFKLNLIKYYKYDWELDEYGNIDEGYYLENNILTLKEIKKLVIIYLMNQKRQIS